MNKKRQRNKYEVMDIITKRMLPPQPRPRYNEVEAIPVKVRRSLERRRTAAPLGAIAMGTPPRVQLSTLYQRSVDLSYIDQVFNWKDEIGRGSFGNVYRVHAKEDSKYYAVKVTNDKRSSIYRDEVSKMLKVPMHINCIQFHTAWEENCRIYIQMELCRTDLNTYLAVYHSLRENLAWEIFVDIGLGLEHLHKHNLIHMDIKPSNIMIDLDGICKLGDFGLLVDLNDLKDPKLKYKNLSEGDSKYVALEVLCEENYTKAADIFSFGLLMMESICDVDLPQSGEKWRLIRNGVEPRCFRRHKMSSSLRALIRKMISKDMENRPKIEEFLGHHLVQNVLTRRAKGNRLDIMEDFDIDYEGYCRNLPIAERRYSTNPMFLYLCCDRQMVGEGTPRENPAATEMRDLSHVVRRLF